ncbi:MAG: response regulator [Solobacterium sp.]|nr:response regulator [Solobacterium sp.]
MRYERTRKHNPTGFLRLILCAALLCSFFFPAVIAEEASETVRVGYYENEVFQEGASDGAVKTGYAYEYYRKLSEYTGWKYDYVYGNYGDLYQKLLDGEIDLLAGLAYKPERAELIGYPDLAMGNETYNLVRHDTDTDITADLRTLDGTSIGVLESAMVDVLKRFLAEKNIRAKILTYQDYETLFSAFENHEIDILAAEGDGAYGRSGAEVLTVFGTSDYFLCVSNRRSDLLEKLNEAQTQLAAEEPNYLSSLRAKYYPVSLSSRAFSLAEKDWLASHDALNIGYLNHYLPYSDTEPSGEVTGMIRDLVPALFSSLGISGITFNYQGYESFDAMISDMSEGVIDAAFPVGGGLYYSEENGIYQSSPVSSSSTELVYKGEYSEAKLTHFAVNENNRMQYYYVTTNFPGAEITLYPSIDNCLQAVIREEVSATTLNGLRANDILKNTKYRVLSLRQLSHSDDRAFGVEIGNEGLLKLLNRGINVLGAEHIQNLAYHYSDGLYSYTFMDLIREHMYIFGTLLLVIVSLIIYFLWRDSKRKKRELAEKEAAQKVLEETNRELAESKEALSNALAAAEHANKAKTTFLNNMSHDIRTPMNAIVGFTALAAAHIDNREQVQDYLSKISVSSQHLLSLINDVLDMSRIESGNLTINESEVHLPDLIHDLRTIIHANVSAKQQDLYFDTQDVKNEDIITDRLRLNQVLLNILSNAIKFTPAGGTISFRVIEKPSAKSDHTIFEFRIKDNGIGMSEEFQKHVFDSFTREKTSTVSGIQGTGLGMAITKNIVDMMGGTITVSSKEGKGSEFIVDIPCRLSPNPAVYEKLPELQGLRALVADDDTDSCLSVCSMLREIGMRPDWTNYGKEAVIRAKEAKDQADEFNVFIIDWMMPDLNGIETVRRIRKVIGDSAPIIILTAYDWADIEQEARDAGVTAFCAKPVFLSELRELLSQPFRSTKNEVPEETRMDFSGKRILLAEDNEMNQMIAEEILKHQGFEVEIADDGAKAVAMIKDHPAGYYDVILMDIQMPNMDGYEASRTIRAMEDKEKADIPILAVTANAFEEDRKYSLEAGLNGHLAKPYDIPEILDTLSVVLK